jgi:ABC-2 type transport system permease protein
MKGFLYHALYDFKTGVRDKTLMLMNYLFPLGFFLLVGMFMTKINPFFIEIIIPGMILFALMSSSLLSLPGTLVSARESGVFRSFRVHGIPSYSLIVIPALGNLIHATIACAIITIGSSLLFGGVLPLNWFWFVVVFILAALCLSTLGILIGIVAQSSRATVLIAQAIYLPSVLLGGLMVPAEMIPESLTKVASLLPATQAIRAFSSFAYTTSPVLSVSGVSLLVLVSSIVINLVLCFMLFQWDAKPADKRRLLFGLFALVPFVTGVLVS